MFCPPQSPRTGRRAAFTLIELLIVIAIIAVLAGLLLSVVGKVQDRAHKVQCINDMRNVKTAMISYYGDYHKYPMTAGQEYYATTQSQDTTFGDPGGYYCNSFLFDILRAIPDGYNLNNERNASQQVYWAGKIAANPAKPREGLTSQTINVNGQDIFAGALVDPWGNQYVVYVDTNLDGDLSSQINGGGTFYSDVSTTPGTVHPGQPPMGLAFSSMGPDGQWGTKGNHKLANSDDIVTWQ